MRGTVLLSLTLALATAASLPSTAAMRRGGGGGGGGGVQHEQQFRAQQQEARRPQEENLRAQEESARQAQQQARQQQEQEARARQQEQARGQQQAEARREQESARAQQQEASREQENARAQQPQARREQEPARAQQQEGRREQEPARAQQQEGRREQESARGPEEAPRRVAQQMPPAAPNMFEFPKFQRPVNPRALNTAPTALEKAVSMPRFDEQLISAGERAHANQMVQNLRQHLQPVPLAQGPKNYLAMQEQTLNYYTNNWQTSINNVPLCISRANTFVAPVPLNEYPYWYQPEPGWIFSNGFTLGDAIRVGLDWLGFGWHPYFGPNPTGFICASNYLPTPWVYYPTYGLWRLVGVNGWAPSGPPYDYTGPISVEVLEPRQITVTDPASGWQHQRWINVPYLYNAYFYPDYDRWGYANRHGYFVWLNV